MLFAATLPSLSKDSRFAGWLLVAILAHALLLLLPSQREQHDGKGRHGLKVSLLAPAQPPPAAPAPASAREFPETPPPPQATAQPTGQPSPIPDSDKEVPAEPAQPTAAYLLDLARSREWRLPQPGSRRQLGVFAPPPLPTNWRPSLTPSPTRFAGAGLLTETEVVDRWLAADGSHNVVITTPGGETYCGRSDAWNPMNPLFEPIRVFGRCGGGGKRTFDMPHAHAGDAGSSERQ